MQFGGVTMEVCMGFVVTVATADAASVVTWVEGRALVTDSPFAGTVRRYLARKHSFPVGDTPHPGCTAGFTTERRQIASDFEMASVLMQLPYETDLNAIIHVHPD